MIRQVTIAKNAGFCSGVTRAVKIAEQAALDFGKVQILGNIVHNEKVVVDLEKKGIKVISGLDQVDPTKPLLFPSHGTKQDIWEKAHKCGLTIIDATCPLVLKIHKAAKLLEEEGRRIIIIGDKGHDEVEAIASQVKNPLIISNLADMALLPKIQKAGVVVQSTQFIGDVGEIISALVSKTDDLRFINTICTPTRQRQLQILELAKNNDVMIIVGSFTSANTKRLAGIALKINPNTHLIQCVDDIDPKWFTSAMTVGISTGASTPWTLLEEVKKKIAELP